VRRLKKLLIADDEAIIRKGLKNSLDWNEIGIEVIGEAKDGKIAYEMAIELEPDIMFVDINMPHLNGLELIKKLKEKTPNCELIIITGYDEFEYAKEAVKLGVFDYILKPVSKKELYETIRKLIEKMAEKKKQDNYFELAEDVINTTKKDILKNLFSKWIQNKITLDEVKKQFDVLNIVNSDALGMILIKVLDVKQDDIEEFELESELLSFCVQNIIEEILEEFLIKISFEDHNKLIVVIYSVNTNIEIDDIIEKIKDRMLKFLYRYILIENVILGEESGGIARAYSMLKAKIDEKSSYGPIVILAKSYIEENYYDQELSLQKIAEKVLVSPTYLSKLINKEMGCSFKDYLTKVRIDKAISFMKNPSYKMYEIAEKVGYNTQHYFSAAFKKEMGVSPNDYKKKR